MRTYPLIFLTIFFIATLFFASYLLSGRGEEYSQAERIFGILFALALAAVSGWELLNILRNNPYSSRRRAALSRYAARAGMTFEQRAEGFHEAVRSIILFQKVGNIEIHNVLRRRTPEYEIAAFDYLAEGTGEDPSTEAGTAIRIAGEGIQLPTFTINGLGRPRSRPKKQRSAMRPWKSWIIQTFSDFANFHLIVIDEDPSFADFYWLTGCDEERVRDLFDSEVRTFFVQLLRRGYRLTVGTCAGQITITPSKMIQPDRLAEHIAIAREILKALTNGERDRQSHFQAE